MHNIKIFSCGLCTSPLLLYDIINILRTKMYMSGKKKTMAINYIELAKHFNYILLGFSIISKLIYIWNA